MSCGRRERRTHLSGIDRSCLRSIGLVDLGVMKLLELSLDSVVRRVGEGSDGLVVFLALNDDGLTETREEKETRQFSSSSRSESRKSKKYGRRLTLI